MGSLAFSEVNFPIVDIFTLKMETKAGIRKLIERLEGLLAGHDPSPLARLSKPAAEALLTLAKAGGKPVAKNRLCHQVKEGIHSDAGDWAPIGRAATVVCELRAVLGLDVVLTVRGLGYVLGIDVDWSPFL